MRAPANLTTEAALLRREYDKARQSDGLVQWAERAQALLGRLSGATSEGLDIFDLGRSHPVVEFLPAWTEIDADTYAEPGMRARVLHAAKEDDDLFILTVDYGPFETHNRAFESHDWCGPNGRLVTAREAGFYQVVEKLYLPSPDVSKLMTPVAVAAPQLVSQWEAEGSDLAYVEWLEQRLLKAEGADPSGDLKPIKGDQDDE